MPRNDQSTLSKPSARASQTHLSRSPRPMRAARITGAVLLVVIALPAIASGVYAVATRNAPEDLPEWLGAPELRLTTFAVLGVAGCVVGAAALALSLALLVWPEKALGPHAPLGRAIARFLRPRSRRREG